MLIPAAIGAVLAFPLERRLSLNPIGWLIGYIYGRNRWQELA